MAVVDRYVGTNSRCGHKVHLTAYPATHFDPAERELDCEECGAVGEDEVDWDHQEPDCDDRDE